MSLFSSFVYVGFDISSFLILSVDKTMALIKGANSLARLVLPTPGRPQNSIINDNRNELV
jgi:hypothetical protein